MPKCEEPCAEPKIPDLPPMIPDNLPPPMKEFVLNMDVIVNHIYHEIRPTIPHPPPILDSESDGEVENYIQTVITPMIMELFVSDIAPALPVCNYPGGGGSFYIQDPLNPNATVPDGDEVLTGALEAMLDNLAASSDPNAAEIIKSLDPAQIVADLSAQAESGEAVEIIIAGANGEMNFKEREFEDDLQGSSMQYNDKSESTPLAK